MTHPCFDIIRCHHRWFESLRIAVLLCLLVLASVSFASSTGNRIELVDGTHIFGEVVSMSNGRYVIRSPSLGQVELPQSSIRAIQPIDVAAPASLSNADIQAIQQKIVSSPELMLLVTALMSDPEVQAALKDPEFVRLVMSGDLQALQGDPRVLHLMSKPSMQAIIGKMQPR